MFAFVFPGQGAQRVGMGKSLVERYPAARHVFAEADEALGKSLSRLCFEGPEDELLLTENSQPAILTMSIAALRVIEERSHLVPRMVAGHSLGECSALVCAGALTLADAVRLVNKRGQFMQEAVPIGQGAMAAVVGMSSEDVLTLCRDAARAGEVLAPANFNSPRQIVISGHAAAVDRAVTLAGERKAAAKKLRVSAPFHCKLMESAAAKLAIALEATSIRDLAMPVIANVDAQAHDRASDIARLLVEQVTASVRWTDIVLEMKARGVTDCIEIGPGRTLGSLIKQIDRAIETSSVESPDELEALVARAAQLQPPTPDGRRVLTDGRVVWNDGMVWDPTEPGAFGF